jgi:hypothetical protein
VIKRAERIQPIGGFGIDRVAAAAEEAGGGHGGLVLRMENLDTKRFSTSSSAPWIPVTR